MKFFAKSFLVTAIALLYGNYASCDSLYLYHGQYEKQVELSDDILKWLADNSARSLVCESQFENSVLKYELNVSQNSRISGNSFIVNVINEKNENTPSSQKSVSGLFHNLEDINLDADFGYFDKNHIGPVGLQSRSFRFNNPNYNGIKRLSSPVNIQSNRVTDLDFQCYSKELY